MSWIEKVKNDLKITCGDGKQYTPQYLNPSKGTEFNLSKFNFPNIDGTLVKRMAALGNTYPIELYFQGENHLDTAKAFEESARDPRPWKVSHPYYGELVVHPSSLEYDNTKHNVSKISGTLLETIEKPRPSTVDSPVDQVMDEKVAVDEKVAQAYANNVTPVPSDITEMQEQNSTLYGQGAALSTGSLGEGYFEAFNQASGAIANATSEPLTAMRRIQAVITAPSLFAASVTDRIGLLTDQFNSMVATLTNLVTPNQKRQFQAAGGTMMTTLAQTAVTGEYATTTDVLGVIDSVLGNYNTYIASLDQMQTENNGSPESYVPDMEAVQGVSDLVNLAISNLFDIALNSQQERFIFLEYDSNPIILTHRFYGLDNEDVNLQRFIDSNNLGLNELINIAAGRRIVYYV